MSALSRTSLWLLIAGHVACAPARAVRPVDQPTSPAASSSPIVISIVGTNDLHGGILPRDGRGGLALLGGVRDAAAQWMERRGGHLRDRDLVSLEHPRWLLAGPPPLR